MVHTPSFKRPLRYHIIHGFTGGKLLSRELRRLLKAQGYEESKHAENADIIITHSAGYWLLPAGAHPKILMLVGAALPQENPGAAYRSANLGMWREAAKGRYLHKRTLWSLYGAGYLIAQPKRNRHIVKIVRKSDPSFRPPTAGQIVFIANQQDPWPKSKLLEEFVAAEPWAFLSLPGSHEHIKQEPAAYVAIINYYAQRLLASANNR